MSLYARQQKRHRCKEQTLECGRRWGWDDLRDSIETSIITICEIDRQSRFNAWDRVLRAGALGWPWGMGWGGRCEGGSGWGTHAHPWLTHVSVWPKPLQYSKVISLQFNINNLIFKKPTSGLLAPLPPSLPLLKGPEHYSLCQSIHLLNSFCSPGFSGFVSFAHSWLTL